MKSKIKDIPTMCCIINKVGLVAAITATVISSMLLTISTTYAQTYSTFTSYSTDIGFVQKEVMQLAQDEKGQMWFATWDGLYSFDGCRFSNYKARPGDGVRLKSNRLEALCTDGTNIWMRGYNGSISCFNTVTASIQDLPLSQYIAKEIYHNSEGGI